jgi:hypothetical protein
MRSLTPHDFISLNIVRLAHALRVKPMNLLDRIA